MLDSDKTLVGLTEEEALSLLKQEGIPARVVSRDGVPLIVTMDLNPNRVNLTITNKKVTKIEYG